MVINLSAAWNTVSAKGQQLTNKIKENLGLITAITAIGATAEQKRHNTVEEKAQRNMRIEKRVEKLYDPKNPTTPHQHCKAQIKDGQHPAECLDDVHEAALVQSRNTNLSEGIRASFEPFRNATSDTHKFVKKSDNGYSRLVLSLAMSLSELDTKDSENGVSFPPMASLTFASLSQKGSLHSSQKECVQSALPPHLSLTIGEPSFTERVVNAPVFYAASMLLAITLITSLGPRFFPQLFKTNTVVNKSSPSLEALEVLRAFNRKEITYDQAFGLLNEFQSLSREKAIALLNSQDFEKKIGDIDVLPIFNS